MKGAARAQPAFRQARSEIVVGTSGRAFAVAADGGRRLVADISCGAAGVDAGGSVVDASGSVLAGCGAGAGARLVRRPFLPLVLVDRVLQFCAAGEGWFAEPPAAAGGGGGPL